MSVADEIYSLVTRAIGAQVPIRIQAWDDSTAGPADQPVLQIRNKDALRRLLWRPGELGLAQAYIVGDIDLDGDIAVALPAVWRAVRQAGRARIDARTILSGLRLAARVGALGPPPPVPDPKAKLSGKLHSRARDRAAIGFHYDLSNEFYQLILDPAMVYSCGYWRADAPGYGLADAQRDKLDLICRKLGLAPGMRMLDVGCGWGALAIHAARHYGVDVDGVTLSQQQFDFATARAQESEVAGKVTFKLCDYRDITDGTYDAISTVEMGEHVGKNGYPGFAASLRSLLAPQGRLLVQQMSRSADAPGGGAFIESYIAPDMHMRPVGQTVDLLEQAGLEVRDVESMREHYVRTVRCWLATLEEKWDEAVELIGEPTARVWRLYLVGGALAFQEGRMGVDQVLAVAATPQGRSGMPPTRGQFSEMIRE